MALGLVLEGGGMRGLFTAGVIDVMMESGIVYDGIIGVSAGACFGCNYKSHQPGRVLRYNMRFCKDPRYMGWRTLLRTGDLVGAEFAYHELPLTLDVFDIERYENDPTEFYIVTTDVHTGEPVYYNFNKVNYESLEWLRASASMPLVSRPVRVDDGRLMLDGGISDSIPLKRFVEMGYKRNIVILTQPRNFFKKPTLMWPFRLFMRRYPKIIAAMARRHQMYNEQLSYVASEVEAGNAFVICPQDSLPVGRVDSDREKMQRVYDMGREACIAALPQLRDFIAKK